MEGSWTRIRQGKKSLAGRLSRVGEKKKVASSSGSRLCTLRPVRVCLRVSVCCAHWGQCVAGAAAPADAPASTLPPGLWKTSKVWQPGLVGVACACGSECECARERRESGSLSSRAHTDMFDRSDMTRAREEAAAGAGPRAPERA